MNTGTAIVVVAIAGGAIFLIMRNQQQQQAAVAAAAAPAPAPTPGGGGIGGLATRVVNQWEHDPLGTKNAAAVFHGVQTVATSAAGEVGSIVHGITSIF